MGRQWLGSTALAVLCAAAVACGPSNAARQAASNGFVITGVRVFDGQRSQSGQNVVVAGGLNRAVGGKTGDWPSLTRIDGTGATLLPGFVDAHTHTQDPVELQQALRFGVTTVLDMFTGPAVEAAPARGRRRTRGRGGLSFCGNPRYGARRPAQYGIAIPTVSNPADAPAFARARKAAGADYLKIVLNGVRAAGVGTPALDRATTSALLRAAHSLGMLVIAHVESLDDVRIAVEGGVDGLAHIWKEGGAAPELATLVARRNVFVIPTLATPDGLVAGSGATLAADPRLRAFLTDAATARLTGPVPGPALENIDSMLAAVRSLHAAGARLLVGSDVPNAITVHRISVHRELELLVKAGLSPEQALTAGTASVATIFRLPDRGRIAPGYRADLVLVSGDPTSDITATRHILRVWRLGVEFDRRLADVASGQHGTRRLTSACSRRRLARS